MAEFVVHEAYDQFVTLDAEGRPRQWLVKPDGLLMIVPASYGWADLVEDGPAGSRADWEALGQQEQRGRDRAAEQ